ncbi:unnamed protein product [Amoebophrya sp. A120]|nr:unnamed protein product [Amoebophrya sp. A120]|eukprot:GSA120T00003274001.1
MLQRASTLFLESDFSSETNATCRGATIFDTMWSTFSFIGKGANTGGGFCSGVLGHHQDEKLHQLVQEHHFHYPNVGTKSFGKRSVRTAFPPAEDGSCRKAGATNSCLLKVVPGDFYEVNGIPDVHDEVVKTDICVPPGRVAEYQNWMDQTPEWRAAKRKAREDAELRRKQEEWNALTKEEKNERVQLARFEAEKAAKSQSSDDKKEDPLEVIKKKLKIKMFSEMKNVRCANY